MNYAKISEILLVSQSLWERPGNSVVEKTGLLQFYLFFFFFSFSVLALAVFPDKWIQLSSKEDASLKAVPHMFGD